MSDMWPEYSIIRARAQRMLRCHGVVEDSAEASVVTQKTVVRFLERGLGTTVDMTKGSRLSLLLGVLKNIVREHVRELRRHRSIPACRLQVSAAMHDPSVCAQIEEQRVLAGALFWRLTERERLAIVKIRGPMFGSESPSKPLGTDYVVAHRAIAKLRAWANEALPQTRMPSVHINAAKTMRVSAEYLKSQANIERKVSEKAFS